MRRYSRILLNAVIAGLMILSWCLMVFHTNGGALSTAGLANMKYFTALSNVFRGLVSAVIAITLLDRSEGRRQKRMEKLIFWNYASTCTVGLTFLVVFAFFGPLYGYLKMIQSANFFYHLVIPVLSMIEFVIFNEKKITMPQILIAALPPLVYGLVYLINLLVNGIGYGPKSNDWYGFAVWGIPTGLCIFAAICVASVLIGLILCKLNTRVTAGIQTENL